MGACACCAVLSVTWRVVAPDPPAVLRRCRRCDRAEPFVSSGRFRVNAAGRRLDVWLVYRCERCGASWNRPVHERVPVATVGTDLDAFLANDPGLATALAHRRAPGVGLQRAAASIAGRNDGPLRVTLAVAHPVSDRLDRLLAVHLAVPRSRVPEMVAAAGSLRRPPRDGDVLTLLGCRRPR